MKTRFVTLLTVMLVLASCNKNESPNQEFSFITNPFTRVAEIGGGLQEFGFTTPAPWTITWNPVEWVTIDESQFAGNAAKRLGEYYVIQMNMERNRRNEDRMVEFTVHTGGKDYVQTIIQARPTLPTSPLNIVKTVPGVPEAGQKYDFSVPGKYEVTLENDNQWIEFVKEDYENNEFEFTFSPLPDGSNGRNGYIYVLLSDGTLLANVQIIQQAEQEEKEAE